MSKQMITVLLTLLLALGGLWIYKLGVAAKLPFQSDSKQPSLSALKPARIDVEGAVGRPGVYEVTPTTPVYQLLITAGGIAEDADVGKLNLARNVRDGEKIMVARQKKAKVKTPKLPEKKPEKTKKRDESQGAIELNAATQVDLEGVPGIRPKLAASILQYRLSHGSFQTIDDLLNIKGIGAKKLKQLKAYLRVGQSAQ